MNNETLGRLSNELVVLSARLVREVRHHAPAMPAASTRLLTLLDELGPSSIGTLAVADRCTQPTMSGLVKTLVTKGWVERRPHPSDNRSNLVALSAEGRDTLARLREENAQVVAQLVERSGRTIDDLSAAVALLADVLPRGAANA